MSRCAKHLLAICLVLSWVPASQAEMGVTATEIVFGQSACFSGPSKNLGVYYRAGILAAFEEQNNQGGIQGRLLKLSSVDDAYEPELAAENAAKFVEDDNVLAVIGGVGTPTAKRIAPVLKTAGIPFVGPFTGADFLRDAEQFPNVINLRAGYLDETRKLVDHIINDLGQNRLGIIYQDDAFGRSVLRNYKNVLEELDIPILAKASFSRNTHAVHAALFALSKADLDAILIVGTYASNSEIINLADYLGHDYIIANLSFVLSHELEKRVNNPTDRIIVTEVVPDAMDISRPIVHRFHQARESQYNALGTQPTAQDFNEVSLEGYILGRFVINVLERMDNTFTRENFMAQALSPQSVALDDWILEFEPGTNTGSHYVRMIDLGGHNDTSEE